MSGCVCPSDRQRDGGGRLQGGFSMSEMVSRNRCGHAPAILLRTGAIGALGFTVPVTDVSWWRKQMEHGGTAVWYGVECDGM